MRYFSREYSVDYASYRFAYGNFCELEQGDLLDPVYNFGYLPYSADPSDPRSLFYMARSLRLPLDHLQLSKKRRYLQRQEPMLNFQRRVSGRNELLKTCDGEWIRQVSDWMIKRFGKVYLSSERLHYILSKPYANTLISWESNQQPIAWALVCRGEKMAHYWFCFYNPELPQANSLGKWLLGDFLNWARTESLETAYLGTGYKLQSSYKTHGLKPCEFWDGSQWVLDPDRLKELQAAD